MALLIECKKICKEYGDTYILNNINLKINSGEKIGIVGSNGMGKTTLANIISGNMEPTSGEVIWHKDGINIGYMKQATEYSDMKSTLSGGEKTKKLLVEILYGKSNMLILDEPTNHLDYLGVKWLIDKVKKFKGTVIIISHDRYFLDETVNKIVEIENKREHIYNGNYSWYRHEKKKQFEDSLHQYNEQQKIKKNINDQIDGLKRWSNKAHKEAAAKAIETGNKFGGKQHNRAKAKKMDNQIKSRIKRLQKMQADGIEKPSEEKQVFFNVNEPKKIGSIVVQAEEISKSFDSKKLFDKSSFYIKHGEKIGLYGSNGCGKSTLIKALLGEQQLEGNLYISPARRMGYVSQEVLGLDEESTILELFNIKNRNELGEIRTKLNLLGFNRDCINKKVKVLSLGERMKLKILLMIKDECDVLVLDEPTNHIDLHVREQLEEILTEYKGTIILVTHDRYMLQKICDKLLVFKNKRITRYEYTLNEYLNHFTKVKSTNKFGKSNTKEEIIIIDNKIAYTLSSLSKCIYGSEDYKKLDEEYKNLIKLKSQYR